MKLSGLSYDRDADRFTPGAAVDLFTSVGAQKFVVTCTTVNDESIWPPSYLKALGRHRARREEAHFTPRALHDALAHMLAVAARKKRYTLPDGRTFDAGENLMIRPVSDKVAFVQIDDLKALDLDKVRDAAFLIHRTSPGNHQAWIAVKDYEGETRKLYSRVLKALGAGDHDATGSTRIAGSRNWKQKYLPDPPMVSIVEGTLGRVMTPASLEQLGLVAAPKPSADRRSHIKTITTRASSGNRPFPSYEMSLKGAPRNSAGTGPDRSKADYWWCYLAAQRNFTVDQIAAELASLSSKANEMNDGDKRKYIYEKARDASADWERDKLRQRGRV